MTESNINSNRIFPTRYKHKLNLTPLLDVDFYSALYPANKELGEMNGNNQEKKIEKKI